MVRAAHTELDQDGARPTILLVKDNQCPTNGPVENALLGGGFTVRSTEESSPIPEVLRENEPDVVVVAVTRPGTALEVLDAVRCTDEQVPVLIVGSREIVDVNWFESAVDQGADDFVAAPASGRVVAAHVQAILRRSSWQVRVPPD
jgi:DNA-binding response OmpR family regulator